MIDAAGAIYVIGGNGGGNNFYKDVWVSTDRGADRTSGATRAGAYEWSRGTSRVVRGTHRYLRGTQLVLTGYYTYSSGTQGVR